MKRRLTTLVLTVACMLSAVSAFPCSVIRSATGVGIPTEMVAAADVILRVTAVEYASAPADPRTRTTGVPDSLVRFRVEETVKGSYAAKEIALQGYISSTDDLNDRPVPYDFVRRGGRAGSCFANSYRQGAQFLLVLKRNTQPGTELTVNWYALGPVNEQLQSETDPWLLWVRQQVGKK